MDADLFILPECSSQDHLILPEGYNMLWCGDDDLKEKGLGVIWKKHLSIQVIPEYKKIKHTLPLLVEGAMFPSSYWYLGQLSGKRRRPTTAVVTPLKEYTIYLDKFPSMVVGDYNCYIGQSGITKEYRHVRGLHSLYGESWFAGM